MSEVGRLGWALAWSAACLLLASAGSAQAESALRLPYPEVFGTIPASTYDEYHQRVGGARLVVENVDDARVHLLIESGIDGGARTVATAELEAVDDGKFLRLVREESRSFDPKGIPMGVLSIDHENGIASCEVPEEDGMATERLALPKQDRVVNVPLTLLFRPLVEGTTDEVTFQFLLCRFGARLVDFDARIVPRDRKEEGKSPIVEVAYRPDFGRFVSLLAERWVPKLSIWFDRRGSNPWIAYRIPLYARGPEVFVIRDGVSIALLQQSH
jgi:hypothetical protein